MSCNAGNHEHVADTHIFLWWLFDDPKLPQTIRHYLKKSKNRALVSSASVWEITTKYRLGKLPRAKAVAQNIPVWIARAGFEPLPILPAHAQLAGSWENGHRDPFDRMLAAQAEIEQLPLATLDQELQTFGIEVFGFTNPA